MHHRSSSIEKIVLPRSEEGTGVLDVRQLSASQLSQLRGLSRKTTLSYTIRQLKHIGIDRVLAAVQKAVLLNTCHAVCSFIDHYEEDGKLFPEL